MSKKRSQQSREVSKKEIVLGKERKWTRSFIFVVSSCAALMILGGFLYFGGSGGSEVATASAKEVSYPVELFEDGKARFFDYKSKEGAVVKYFVVRSSDGVLRAAFDACDVCWPSGKGYQQEGDFMICRNCGKRFASVQVNVVWGGCNPAPLERRIVDEKLVIQAEDVQKGARYFDFSRRG